MNVYFTITAFSTVVVRDERSIPYVAPLDGEEFALFHGLAPELVGFEIHDGYADPRRYRILRSGETLRVRGALTLNPPSVSPTPTMFWRTAASRDLHLRCSVSYWMIDDDINKVEITEAFLRRREYANSVAIWVRGAIIENTPKTMPVNGSSEK